MPRALVAQTGHAKQLAISWLGLGNDWPWVQHWVQHDPRWFNHNSLLLFDRALHHRRRMRSQCCTTNYGVTCCMFCQHFQQIRTNLMVFHNDIVTLIQLVQTHVCTPVPAYFSHLHTHWHFVHMYMYLNTCRHACTCQATPIL